MSNNIPVLERNVGASAYITVDMSLWLDAGQQVSAATWTSGDTDLATLVADTSAISANGTAISAKFSHLAAGLVRITVAVTTSNPTETEPIWIVVRGVAAPEV